MSRTENHPPASADQQPPPAAMRVKHAWTTRLWHWLTVLSLAILFMSGLNIFNAHPMLYWGSYGANYDQPWLVLERFPHWATIPGYYSLADARLWHFFFASLLAFTLLAFLIASLFNRHVQRDLHIRKSEWAAQNIKRDLARHARFEFVGETPRKGYNWLQKISYILTIFILIPGMIFTGIAMSPAMDANWTWLLDVFGGRQSARSLHFIFAWSLFAFFLVHVALVLLTRPLMQIRGMMSGGRKPVEERA